MRIPVAQHKTSKIIFKYLGIENPELIMRCCKFYKLRKKKMFISLVGLSSPFTYSPSEQRGWVYTCLKYDNLNMTGEDVDAETRKLTFETEEGLVCFFVLVSEQSCVLLLKYYHSTPKYGKFHA